MKATRDFYERLQSMKLYKKGDEYVNADAERVAYLVKEGYIVEPKAKKETKKKSGE